MMPVVPKDMAHGVGNITNRLHDAFESIVVTVISRIQAIDILLADFAKGRLVIVIFGHVDQLPTLLIRLHYTHRTRWPTRRPQP